MPELPEVETVREGLARHVLGAQVTDLEVRRPASIRLQPGGEEGFAQALLDQTITEVARRGKFLWLNLDGGQALVAHLGMSGQLLVKDSSAQPEHRHLRVRLHLKQQTSPDAAATPITLDFVDQRVFGHLSVTDLVPTGDQHPAGWGTQQPLLPDPVAHIARDLLDEHLDLDQVYAKLRRKRTGIKRALLDQTLASGIGNIYADEALWQARLHYARATDTLRRPDFNRLFEVAREVMERALVEGGTSFDALYVNVNGESGYFAHSLNAYGRAGLPCNRCGALIVREQFMNRSAHLCPKCQPRPRGGRW